MRLTRLFLHTHLPLFRSLLVKLHTMVTGFFDILGGSPERVELADFFFRLAASTCHSGRHSSTANASFLTLVLGEARAREPVVVLGFRVTWLGFTVVGATPVRLG